MNDLISRQAAIDALNKLDISDGVGISSVACDLQEEAIRSIENLPSAQPERKKGKWISFYHGEHAKSMFSYSCSICAMSSPENKTWYYCPNCGADMRGEQDD